MAYFSNGTEGSIFESKWCGNCVHWEGCPVWAAHLIHNYDQVKNEQLKSALNMLITTTEDGLYADECRMFLARQAQ